MLTSFGGVLCSWGSVFALLHGLTSAFARLACVLVFLLSLDCLFAVWHKLRSSLPRSNENALPIANGADARDAR